MNNKWKELQSLCDSRQNQLETSLLQLGQFQEALTELSEWIDESTDVWGGREISVVSLEDLESLQNELEVYCIMDKIDNNA